ncbi:effector-associated constant component EACC1 [Streptomyces sp. NPDC058256]|uniref:effector-associated constant component EACC1 n=1 Tax=Streptomyces sp. NPDC058256 TaxID=3346408 RepID=UPI0036E9F4AA
MVERKPDGRFACELVINGDVRADAPAALGRKLFEEGAASEVVPVYVAQPAPGRRAGDLVEVATLVVTSAGTLVAVIDTIRGWLTGQRNSPSGSATSGSASSGNGTGAADGTGGVTSITVIMGDDRVEIIQPSTAAEERLVEAFVRRHSPS